MTTSLHEVSARSADAVPRESVRLRRDHASVGLGGRLVLAAALVVGVGRAAVGLGSSSLGYDEAFAVRLAGGSWSDLFQVGFSREPFAVLDAILLRGWASVFGWSVTSVRGMSVAAFAVTIVVVHLLAARLSGRVAASVAPLVVAVHGGLASDARSAAGGAVGTAVIALAVLALVVAVDRPTAYLPLVTAAVLAALSGYATPYGAVAVVAVACVVVCLARDSRRAVAAAGAYVLSAWIPLGFYLGSGSAANSGWLSEAGAQNYVGSRSAASLLGSMNFWVAGTVLLLAAVVGVAWVRRRALEEWTGTDVGAPLMLAWALVPLGVGLAISALVPVLTPQVLTVCAPAVALIVGAAVQLVWAPRLALVVAAGAVVAVVVSAAPVATTVQGSEVDWREVARALAASAGSADVVAVEPSYNLIPLAYAVDELQLEAQMPASPPSGSWNWRSSPLSADEQRAAPAVSYEWLVTSDSALADLVLPIGTRIESTRGVGGVVLVHLIPA